ncbi:hypothetical protein [Inconstantimicrobium mannanitabidum]|uniref:Uncharacterized protein n=1 Tax=Inconstantimicrobium mannanitabidum TaxID=1604901 RepID=A0ACB5RDP9_9CLOT|nr:hypothetical protein [Clostridium sp. TW13]GKX66886.1 hypothetical protein rsdtw13_21440 [Clostridium sp. TW13]
MENELDEIQKNIREYFASEESFNNIIIKKITDEYIEIGMQEYRISVRLMWVSFSDYLDFENANDLIEITRYISDGYSEEIFYYASQRNLYYENNLKKIEVWRRKLNSFNNRYIEGAYIKEDKFGEFLLEENRDTDLCINEHHTEKLYLRFNIGKIKIVVSNPTQIFKLMFMNSNIFGIDSFWDKFLTIKIIGAKRDELNNYLQQAMFILNIYNNNKLLFGVENKLRHTTNQYEYEPNEKYLYFEETAHVAPLAYYNEAINLTNEASFLYYYKVLEYFFIICQKEKLKNVIECFNIEEEKIRTKRYISNQEKYLNTCKNDNKLINEISKIYTAEERICLRNVIKNINADGTVLKIVKEYFFEEMLEDDDAGNIDISNMKIESFIDRLYKYRNSIVHGKSDFKFNSRVPNYLEKYQDSVKMESWNYIIQKLALLCVKKFCYNNSHLIKFSI